MMHFHQTYVNDALWDRDERCRIWGQKVKAKGHSGLKYGMLEPSLYRQTHTVLDVSCRVRHSSSMSIQDHVLGSMAMSVIHTEGVTAQFM